MFAVEQTGPVQLIGLFVFENKARGVYLWHTKPCRIRKLKRSEIANYLECFDDYGLASNVENFGEIVG